MSLAVAYLIGQMTAASIAAAMLAAFRQWRWMFAPFASLTIIWSVGYWIAIG